MAIQFESSIDVVGSISATASAYVYSLHIGNQSGAISNRIWFDTGGSPVPGLYFEGGQPKFIIYSSVSNIFHDTYHPNADTWTNARTITIGNTGKSVNGSANVSWTLAEIGAQPALTNPITGTGTTNYLSKFTGSTTLGNSLVYDNGTNVGIGTPSPAYKLDVAGNARFTSEINMEEDHYINLRFEVPDNNISEQYILLCRYAGGNDVNGTINMDRTSGLRHACSVDIILSAGSSATPVGGLRAIGTSGAGNPKYNLVTCYLDAVQYVALKIQNPDNYYESTGAYFTGRIKSTGVKLVPKLASELTSIVDFEVNTLHTFSGDAFFRDGNVGIGTDSPSEKLEVAGNVILDAASTRLKLKGGVTGTNSGIDWTFNTDSTQYARIDLDYDTRGSTGLLIDSGYPMTLDYSSGSFSVKKNGSSELTILNGNVGIGESNPDTLLHITGDSPTIKLEDNVSGNYYNPKIEFYGFDEGGTLEYISNPSFSGMRLHYRNVGLNDDTFLNLKNGLCELQSAGYTGGVTLKTDGVLQVNGVNNSYFSNGNVGIGTTSPTAKLHVEGNVLFNSNLRIGGSNTFKSCTYGAQNGLVAGVSNVLGGIANGIIGYQNTIDCTAEPWNYYGGNFIAGRNNTINNQYSHANAVFGQGNTVGDPTTSSNSVAGILVNGANHSTFGDNSFAFGESCFTDIFADRSLTGGFDSNNFGGFGSVAIGAGATASAGNNQYAFGTGVTTPTSASAAYGADQFVVGKFNVYSTGGRVHRFAVGNGFSDGIRNNALNVDNFGRTGLGVIAPSYQLQLSSNSAAKPTSSSWTVVSDERVKTNIQDYTTGLTEILQINPKTFDYNGKAGFDTTAGNIGIIAQDVQSIMPETINTYEAKLNEDDAEETELFNFDSHPIQFALINAVKELNAKIEMLQAKIQTLEGN